MKPIEQYFSVILFSLLNNVVQAFNSLGEILVTLMCGHSNETYQRVLLYGTVHYTVQGGSHFQICG